MRPLRLLQANQVDNMGEDPQEALSEFIYSAAELLIVSISGCSPKKKE